jgi:hypothetical protein
MTYMEIKKPRISFVLAGTPRQIQKLIPNVENGLFSRISFYKFEYNGGFNDPFQDSNYEFEAFFEEKALWVKRMYDLLKMLPKPVLFEYTKDQEKHFNSVFSDMLGRNKLLLGNDFNANVMRLGVITFRLSMILSTLRIDYTHDIPEKLVCRDEDFNSAVKMALVLEEHAQSVYMNMPEHNLSGNMLKFYNELPDTFNRKVYLVAAEKIGVRKKTAEGYLKGYEKLGMIIHEYNKYSKVKKRK